MPLFPAYVNLSDKHALVVGGGKVATRKVEKLLSFTRNITIVAPKIRPELRKLAKEKGLKVRRRIFIPSDLRDKFLVIVAVDNIALQEKIFKLCQKRGVLCNSVDSPDYCNFIFPSLIVKDELVIGINTGGQAPALSKRIREILETCLPENIEEILKRVAEERNRHPKGEERQRMIIELVDELLRGV